MPLDLKGAIPPPPKTFGPDIQSEVGAHKAYLVGMGGPWPDVDAQRSCGFCKGSGKNNNGDDCQLCNGSGKKTTTKVNLKYQLQNGNIEEEAVTFRLSPPGMNRNQEPLSASTLYLRFRALSGFSEVDKIQTWAAHLPTDMKVPCTVIVGLSAGQTPRPKITDVLPRQVAATPSGNGATNASVLAEVKETLPADFEFEEPADSESIPF